METQMSATIFGSNIMRAMGMEMTSGSPVTPYSSFLTVL